jgi:hypothetical protein
LQGPDVTEVALSPCGSAAEPRGPLEGVETFGAPLVTSANIDSPLLT